MAIVHRATITPTKLEIVEAWADRQPWGGSGPLEQVGSYRFDDPAGEVGVEALVVERGDVVLHVPMTYRGAPLEGGDAHLMARMQHSVLGERWIYEAQADPVGQACFVGALTGRLEQAPVEIWEDGRLVERREPTARVSPVHDEARRVEADAGGQVIAPGDGTEAGMVSVPTREGSLRLARVLDPGVRRFVPAAHRLEVAWPGGRAVVAALH